MNSEPLDEYYNSLGCVKSEEIYWNLFQAKYFQKLLFGQITENIYFDCVLLKDFGIFKKGEQIKIIKSSIRINQNVHLSFYSDKISPGLMEFMEYKWDIFDRNLQIYILDNLRFLKIRPDVFLFIWFSTDFYNGKELSGLEKYLLIKKKNLFPKITEIIETNKKNFYIGQICHYFMDMNLINIKLREIKKLDPEIYRKFIGQRFTEIRERIFEFLELIQAKTRIEFHFRFYFTVPCFYYRDLIISLVYLLGIKYDLKLE